MPQELRSTVKSDATLEITLVDVPEPPLGESDVLVKVQAAPINPSDLGLLFGQADMSTAKYTGTTANPTVTADIPKNIMKGLAGRLDQSLPVGNEGAGTVVKAGAADKAQALLGKTVSIIGGATYSQLRALPAQQCLAMPSDVTPRDAASWFVNPMTAQGMIETMRMENHTALVHTAAASNLGQMLNKLCLADGIDLVNIVRKQEQADILSGIGAKYICNSSSPSFMSDLTEALVATGATLAFDAIGGGDLAGRILTCMEIAVNKTAKEYSRYGSTTYKQVYIYGGLDRGPTVVNRNFGLTWGLGGWLLMPFLQKAGKETVERLRQRVAAEIKTTFASHYTEEVSLAGMLTPEAIGEYGKQATGTKYLVNPNKED